MIKTKSKTEPLQINKNNKTKPENIMKKEYSESFEELKKSIIKEEEQKA